MLIGMIGIVVMMQTFAVSEGFKRTATSGTDAQVNGASRSTCSSARSAWRATA